MAGESAGDYVVAAPECYLVCCLFAATTLATVLLAADKLLSAGEMACKAT